MIERFKAARRAGAPLVAITTPDPAETVLQISSALPSTPMIQWDIVRGLCPVNDEGDASLSQMLARTGWDSGEEAVNIVEVLRFAEDLLPQRTILFVHNLQLYLEKQGLIQAIWNLRDTFKKDLRTFVALSPGMALPQELVQDFLVFDSPLPEIDEIRRIVRTVLNEAAVCAVKANKIKSTAGAFDDALVERAADACCGLTPFAIEQIVAMSIRFNGKITLDLDFLEEKMRKVIEQTPGLSVPRIEVTFDDLGGLDNIKRYLSCLFEGRRPPRAIVFIDEIEKMFSGSTPGLADSSGVSQDFLGTFLTEMQERRYSGIILLGPPGTGKSAIAKAAAGSFRRPLVMLDLGGMKGSYVGQSEANIRAAFRVIYSVSQGEAFFIATCNRLETLAPELRRRFKGGLFFVDLPGRAELAKIWEIYLKRFSLDPEQQRPDDDGWTGAEVEQCCSLAWQLGVPLTEAAKFIVPVAQSAAAEIKALRQQANRRYLSAGSPGVYVYSDKASGDRAARRVLEV